MSTWTRTLPEKLNKADLDDLRVHLEHALRALGDALHHLPDLADTRQAGTGYATAATLQVQAAQVRKDREARYPTKGIGLGQRWFKRADIPAYAAGARPVPVNLPAVSIDAEIPMALIHLNQRVRRDLEIAGVCPIVKPAAGRDRQGRPITQYPNLVEIFRETRQLTRLITDRKQLLRAVRTLEDLADRASTVVNGPNRMPGDAPCPHCGRHTLVGYVEEGIVRCEPPNGQRCVCADAYCACHTRRDHRHEWTRTPPAYLQGSERKRWRSHTNSLEGLSRAIANAAATRQQGAPAVKHLHHIEVGIEEPGRVRFRCDGDRTDPCHIYPDCDCETGSDAHASGEGVHVDVPHDECVWVTWMHEVITVGEAAEVYSQDVDADDLPDLDHLRSGPIEFTWDADIEFPTWQYSVELEAARS